MRSVNKPPFYQKAIKIKYSARTLLRNMDVHQHFCNQILDDFKASYEDVLATFQRTLAGLNASRDQQEHYLQTCDDHLKPNAQLVLAAINLHIQRLHQQNWAELTLLSDRWILDGLEGHQALEGNQDILANKMAFRERFINSIRETAEFQPSERVFTAMDDFLIDEDVDRNIVLLLDLLNLPSNNHSDQMSDIDNSTDSAHSTDDLTGESDF